MYRAKMSWFTAVLPLAKYEPAGSRARSASLTSIGELNPECTRSDRCSARKSRRQAGQDAWQELRARHATRAIAKPANAKFLSRAISGPGRLLADLL